MRRGSRGDVRPPRHHPERKCAQGYPGAVRRPTSVAPGLGHRPAIPGGSAAVGGVMTPGGNLVRIPAARRVSLRRHPWDRHSDHGATRGFPGCRSLFF